MRADGGSSERAVLTRPTSWAGKLSTRIGLAVAIAVFAGAQLFSSWRGLPGPVDGLTDDIFGRGTIGATPWAALGLALIGVHNRARLLALASAAGLCIALTLGLLLAGRPVQAVPRHLGAMALLVVVLLAVFAVVRWKDRRRDDALRGIALAGLLVAASKISDLWLAISVQAGTHVLDQYTLLADQALGQPSWVVASVLGKLGPVATLTLEQVYSGLPLAAMVVTVWQLRAVQTAGWPGHYLVRTFLLLGLTGPLIYVLFPVVGPMFAFGTAGNGLQLSDSWPVTIPPLPNPPVPFLFDSFTPRNCMPSMHTAWALTVFIHSRRGPRWLRWGGSFWLIATLCATLGFGFHYGADLIAGAVLCMTVESALRSPELGWTRHRFQLVAAGLAVLAALLLSYRFLAPELAALPVLGGMWMLGALAVVTVVFYSCWFAAADSTLGRWGRWWLGQPRQPELVGVVPVLRADPDPQHGARNTGTSGVAPAVTEATPT